MTGGNFHAIHEIQSCFTCWCCRPVGISDDQLFWSKSIHSTSLENHFGPSSKLQIVLLLFISKFPEPGLILSFAFLKPQFLDSWCWDQKRYPKSRSRFFPAPTGPLVGETGTNSWLLPVTAIHDWLPLFWPLQTCLLIKSYLSSFSSGTFVYNSWQAFILNTTPAKAVLFCACPVEFDWDRHESGFRPRISDCRSRQPASKYMGMFSDERRAYFQMWPEIQRVRQSRHLG